MNKVIQILKFHFDSRLSYQKIAQAMNVSKGAVHNCLKQFKNSNLHFADLDNLTEEDLKKAMFPEPKPNASENPLENNRYPDFAKVHLEMLRPHVTLKLLYEEFKNESSHAIGQSQFYEGYKRFIRDSKVTMPMDHAAGDKFFVDYSGDSISYFDKDLGEHIKTELFVGTWGASCFTYAEVSLSQKAEEWVNSHLRAFKYCGCTPRALVPDNLKAAVIKPSLYDPEINLLYGKMAEHHCCAILPARVRKPQDKGIVENHVLHIQRYILGRLRNHTFYSLHEVNIAVRELLEEFNDKTMPGYDGMSRRTLFWELDKKHAKELPQEPFEITHIKQGVKIAPNYHILFESHYYSLPYTLVGERVDIYQKKDIIEIYHKGVHVARHQRSPHDQRYTTRKEHMPKSHEYIKSRSTPYYISKAEEVGTSTAAVIKKLFEIKIHPEQGYNSASGILTLAHEYGVERIENACKRALRFNNASYKTIKNILLKELDKKECDEHQYNSTSSVEDMHENIRGPEYYTLQNEQSTEVK